MVNSLNLNIIHNNLYNYRGKHMRIFMSGDYELVSKMFGISGASGRVI